MNENETNPQDLQENPVQETVEQKNDENMFDMPPQEQPSQEPDLGELVSHPPESEHPEPERQTEEELREEADKIFRTEEQKLVDDMEKAAKRADRQAKTQAVEPDTQKESVWVRILRGIAHAIRYVVDPSYRHDCQIASALERRADLNAQVKAYEARKAETMKQEMDRDENKQQSDQEKETEKEPEKEYETTDKLQIAKDLVDEIIGNIEKIPDKEIAWRAKKDRYGLLNLAQGEIDRIQNNPNYEQDTAKNILNTLFAYRDAVINKEDIAPVREQMITNMTQTVERYIEETMKEKDLDRETAIGAIVGQNQRYILALDEQDITPKVARAAYERIVECERTIKEKENPGKPFGEKEREFAYKKVMPTYPQVIKAFDVEKQKKAFAVDALIYAPEALLYMDPKAIDTKTIERLENKLSKENEKRKARNQQLLSMAAIKKDVEKYAKPMTIVGENGEPQTVIATNAAMSFISELNRQQELGNISIVQEAPSVPEPVQEQSSLEFTDPVIPDIPADVLAAASGVIIPPEEFLPESEPDVSQQYEPGDWMNMPEFSDAVMQATINLANYDLIGGPGPEDIKLDVLTQNPELYRYLPDQEKTIAATIEAVSRDLSLIQFVPDEDRMPEYEDRDELKGQILEKAGQLAKEDAIHSEHKNVRSIINESYAKVTGSDTKESKEMKKKLKEKSFKLAEDLTKGSQGLEY